MDGRIIGILGGMGPEATVDLYLRIIKLTPAKKDQDHIRVIIFSNPKIPDRTAAILGTGPNPLPEMIATGKMLEQSGADFLIMPCNTAHFYHSALQAALHIPVLNMIQLSAKKMKHTDPLIYKAGLLATDGTIYSRLYEEAFKNQGIEVVIPKTIDQPEVMKAIYNYIKKGDLDTGSRILHRIAESFIDQGANVVICGCTEVSLVLKNGDLPIPILDPLQVLAEEAVHYALEG
jgi:aspartate racemase